MTFPHYFYLFGHRLHPHTVMELIAYTGGFQLYLKIGRSRTRPTIPFEQNMWLIVGCVFGALLGSKVLAWVESAPDYWQHRHELAAWVGGKTIVGGLLGGWAGVEIAKWFMRITQSTGDGFVFPLICGQCIGRVGCFLTGLDDHTHGNFTNLPWGVDFGDGPRHPTQLYEIAFLLSLGALLWIWSRRPRPQGAMFCLYMGGYLTFRFFVEFIKPTYRPFLHLSAIQMASLLGLFVAGILLRRRVQSARRGGIWEPEITSLSSLIDTRPDRRSGESASVP